MSLTLLLDLIPLLFELALLAPKAGKDPKGALKELLQDLNDEIERLKFGPG